MSNKLKLRVLHTIHATICVFWFALFFIPLTWWPTRFVFQFWWAMFVVVSELIWSQYAFGKATLLICPLTTWTQELRGFSREKKENHEHSYFTELFNFFGIKISSKTIGIILKITFVIIILQYIWYKLYF